MIFSDLQKAVIQDRETRTPNALQKFLQTTQVAQQESKQDEEQESDDEEDQKDNWSGGLDLDLDSEDEEEEEEKQEILLERSQDSSQNSSQNRSQNSIQKSKPEIINLGKLDQLDLRVICNKRFNLPFGVITRWGSYKKEFSRILNYEDSIKVRCAKSFLCHENVLF